MVFSIFKYICYHYYSQFYNIFVKKKEEIPYFLGSDHLNNKGN